MDDMNEQRDPQGAPQQGHATGTADAPTQGNYVLLDVSYEATEGELNYNLFDWTIRDAEGRRYDAGGSYDGYEPGLSSGTLS